jgi:hypothetical protein
MKGLHMDEPLGAPRERFPLPGSKRVPLHPDTIRFGSEAFLISFGREPENDDEVLTGALIWLDSGGRNE